MMILGALAIYGCAPERDLDSQLVVAARKGDISPVERLVAAGVSVNAREDITAGVDSGSTPLLAAASEDHTKVLEFLLKKGANTELAYLDITPLAIAAASGHTECVALLLKYGAKVNVQNAAGFTPLIDASRKGHTEVVRLLLQYGADPSLRVQDGNTALSWARARNYQEIEKMLLKAGAREIPIDCAEDKRDLTTRSTSRRPQAGACSRG
jgi:ankyrin repeat protein